MKKTAFLMTAFVSSLLQAVSAATYTNLSAPQCDEENHIIYDGQGKFMVASAGDTETEVQLNLKSLHSYVNSNDYRSGSPLLLWDTNAISYGVADMADMSKPTGQREPGLCFCWAGEVWQPKLSINYATLRQHAVGDTVRLKLRNNQSSGVSICAVGTNGEEKELLRADGLKSVKINRTNAYHVNLNYVTALTIDTQSTMNTAGYVPPKDYRKPFVSGRGDGNTLKRVMFMGDSITHGVNDCTWRWQLFKILVDNGIEAEIVGPREGYTPGYSKLTTSDAADSYGGVHFPNVHLAQSSGRTHNIISGSNEGMSGVNYGGHSTRSAAGTYNCDTWCCLMGTNDLLSDGGYTEEKFVTKIQNLLGGTVSCKDGKYSRKENDNWGNMGRIAEHVLKESTDTLYVMAVPCWGRHHNNNQPERHLAVQQYNMLLRSWVKQYSAKFDKNLVFADINRGMVDFTHSVPFSWPDSMSNRAGRDGLHPNEQGSLIIAGRLAQAMGISGRTAGLPRADAKTWTNDKSFRLRDGDSKTLAKGDFSESNGYSAHIRATFSTAGDNESRDNTKALRVELSDGVNKGLLNMSENCIMWGDRVLYCAKNDSAKTNLRIVWHPGNEEKNILRGYYVWVDDLLIGQGLAATEANGANGIRITADGGEAQLYDVSRVDKAYAPLGSGKQNEENSLQY